jgi:hypothetical protein
MPVFTAERVVRAIARTKRPPITMPIKAAARPINVTKSGTENVAAVDSVEDASGREMSTAGVIVFDVDFSL